MEKINLRESSELCHLLSNYTKEALVDQVSIDSRTLSSSNSLFITLEGTKSHGTRFLSHAKQMGARFAVVEESYTSSSEELFPYLLKVKDPLKTLQELALLYRSKLKANVICITGSYGKTILKGLLSNLLSTHYHTYSSPDSFNSQIGVPLSLFEIPIQTEYALIEAGISHPGEMERLREMTKPNYGIVTNIGCAHLASMQTKELIASEKMALFSDLPQDSWLLLPNDPLISPPSSPYYYWDTKELPYATFSTPFPSPRRLYDLHFPDGTRFKNQLQEGHSDFLDLINIAIKGAYLLQIPAPTIQSALSSNLSMNLDREIWISPQGKRYLNDTRSQTPLTIPSSLRWLHTYSHPKGKKHFIFGGGQNKSTSIPHLLHSEPLDSLWIFQDQELYHTLKKTLTHLKVEYAPSLEQVFEKIAIEEKDTLLIRAPKKLPINALISNTKDPISPSHLRINLSCIEHNIEIIKAHHPHNQQVMVMIKAMAYGTETSILSSFLSTCGVNFLGVAYVSEAIHLKREDVKQEIFVMHCLPYEIPSIVENGFQIAVSDSETIIQLNEEAKKGERKVKVHLHVDTGMHRLGSSPEQAISLATLIEECSHLIFEGVMSHLSVAELSSEKEFTVRQITIFNTVVSEINKKGIFPSYIHLANTAGALCCEIPGANMLRIGLGIFGLLPSTECTLLGLRSALSLETVIAAIHLIKKGETVSYERTYTVQEEEEHIAVLPIGHFDGIDQSYSNKGAVLIHGKRAPIVGKVCMDYMMVNITHIPEAQTGDPVLIFGKDLYGNHISPETFARDGGKSIYELITSLGPRIQRIFV